MKRFRPNWRHIAIALLAASVEVAQYLTQTVTDPRWKLALHLGYGVVNLFLRPLEESEKPNA